MAAPEGSNQEAPNKEQQSQNLRDRLVQKIHEKRVVVKAFVQKEQRRNGLLTNLNIFCAGIAATLTAGPAVGGDKFTVTVQTLLKLSTDSTVWRTLCLLALVLSLVALIANNLYRTQDLANRLAKAQAGSALLEGLETLVEFGIYSVEDATRLYQQYISDVDFIPGI